MKNIQTESFERFAKSKYPKSETEPYNPWAVCNKSTGGKKKGKEKFERCVQHLKDENKEKNAQVEEMKDMRGLPRHYRTNETPEDVFQRNLDRDLSGEADEDREQRLDDIFEDIFRKVKEEEKVNPRHRQPAFACVIEAKKED